MDIYAVTPLNNKKFNHDNFASSTWHVIHFSFFIKQLSYLALIAFGIFPIAAGLWCVFAFDNNRHPFVAYILLGFCLLISSIIIIAFLKFQNKTWVEVTSDSIHISHGILKPGNDVQSFPRSSKHNFVRFNNNTDEIHTIEFTCQFIVDDKKYDVFKDSSENENVKICAFFRSLLIDDEEADENQTKASDTSQNNHDFLIDTRQNNKSHDNKHLTAKDFMDIRKIHSFINPEIPVSQWKLPDNVTIYHAPDFSTSNLIFAVKYRPFLHNYTHYFEVDNNVIHLYDTPVKPNTNCTTFPRKSPAVKLNIHKVITNYKNHNAYVLECEFHYQNTTFVCAKYHNWDDAEHFRLFMETLLFNDVIQ